MVIRDGLDEAPLDIQTGYGTKNLTLTRERFQNVMRSSYTSQLFSFYLLKKKFKHIFTIASNYHWEFSAILENFFPWHNEELLLLFFSAAVWALQITEYTKVTNKLWMKNQPSIVKATKLKLKKTKKTTNPKNKLKFVWRKKHTHPNLLCCWCGKQELETTKTKKTEAYWKQ